MYQITLYIMHARIKAYAPNVDGGQPIVTKMQSHHRRSTPHPLSNTKNAVYY